MLLHWTPPKAEPCVYVFRTHELPPRDYEAVEGLGRWASLADFDEAVRASVVSAWRVALWLCLRRDDPDLALDAVQPAAGEIVFTYEPVEELALAEFRLTDPDLPDDQRAMLEAALPAIREAVEGKDLPASGPARSRTSGTRAASSSRRSSASRSKSKRG